uniref:Uncharacterized protein n=1 Tax=Neogobius melanostomus TaxID=47308 RepID=A0A8C6TQT8_9GOBI
MDEDTLTSFGAKVDVVDDAGMTPLHKAAGTLNKDIILLKCGADPNKCNNQGLTPLQEACQMGCSELVDLLLIYGGNINKVNKAGENSLFIFLNRGITLTNNKLLSKLFGLTSPLIFHNKSGQLPSSLSLPCSSKFKGPILRLAQDPRSLKSICKAFIYLQHVQNREEWRQILPTILYEFVFNKWDILDKILLDRSGR